MKVFSRKEISKNGGKARYKEHDQTSAEAGRSIHGLYIPSVYVPGPACKPDAEAKFWIAFGMDGRRVLLELSFEETAKIRQDLDDALARMKPRRVK